MIYLDTSALVRAWRLKIAPAELTRSHSLAEFYSTLTNGLTVDLAGVKTRIQFTPRAVAEAAQETFAKMKFSDLTAKQSLDELKAAAGKNIQSANIHDWMHAAVARRENCTYICTTNEKHFKQVSDLQLVAPADFFKS